MSEKPKVLMTRSAPGPWRQILESAGAAVEVGSGGANKALARDEFLAAIRGCTGVLGMLTDRWDAEAFEAAGPQLRIVANYAVGFNNIDLAEAEKRGVVVTNTPDVLTAATADIAWGLLMAAARRFYESEKCLRNGGFHGWGPNDWIGVDLEGRTLGILGAGRIGTAIARRSMGWNMKVIYSHRSAKPDFEKATGGTRVEMEQLLREADFISISVPLNAGTKHLIGAKELALMKLTAVLVNTARGAVIDEKALVEALKSRRIFAAGLDVYEEEPKLVPGLAECDNAILLPHVGSSTFDTRDAMSRLAAESVVAVLQGREPRNRVR